MPANNINPFEEEQPETLNALHGINWQGQQVNFHYLARNYIDEIKSPETTSEIDKKKLIELDEAAQLLEQKKLQEQEKWYSQPMLRKQREYIEYLRRKRLDNMSGYEIRASEIPIAISSLNNRQINEILNGQPAICAEKKCKLNIPYKYAYFAHGQTWCSLHVPILNTCANCKNLRHRNDLTKVTTYDHKTIPVCQNCLATTFRCRDCGDKISSAYIEIKLCERCMAASTDAPRRPYSHNLKWVDEKPGDIYKSSRLFSCEIEGVAPSRNYAQELGKKLPSEMGIGHDGSVHGYGYGFEVQTPRLGGKRGEELIYRALSVLKSIRASVNETCGMHIHLDGKDFSYYERDVYPHKIIQLWKTYLIFEDVLLSFIPYSRRNNEYCRPLASAFQLTELDTIETVADLEKFFYKSRSFSEVRDAKQEHYHPSRYFGINFNSLFAQGHLEIRSHSGTFNAKKILEWANLHACIMDVAPLISTDYLNEANNTLSLKEKTNMLFSAIKLPQKSREYFWARQKKFSKKQNNEDEMENAVEKQFKGFDAIMRMPNDATVIRNVIITEE